MMNTFNGMDDNHDMHVDDLYAFMMQDALCLMSSQLVAYSDYYYNDSDSSCCHLHIYDDNNLKVKYIYLILFWDGQMIAESP